MQATFKKSSPRGNIIPPPSKSYSHRLIIAGALTSTPVKINNIVLSNDIVETIHVLEQFGKRFEFSNRSLTMYGEITPMEKIEFWVSESGTTFRMLIPIAMAFSSHVVVHSTKALIKRGINVYVEAFTKKGVDMKIVGEDIIINGGLPSGEYEIPGYYSSQYISGLLYALPLLKERSVLKVVKPVCSEDYINITLSVLNDAKVSISNNDYIFDIVPSTFQLKECTIEPDYSNASFLEALNHIGGNVHVVLPNTNSLQGDKVYQRYFKVLGCGFATLDIKNCIDLGPILFVIASLHRGAKFTNTSRLRIKESDRAIAMKEELAKFGVDMIVNENEVIVNQSELHAPTEILESHNDHRIAMALSILCLKYGGTINQIEAIKKSYPHFLKDIIRLNGEVKTHD